MVFNFLDSSCSDEFVQAFAVERLRELQDEELIDYLLQLVQVFILITTAVCIKESSTVIYRH